MTLKKKYLHLDNNSSYNVNEHILRNIKKLETKPDAIKKIKKTHVYDDLTSFRFTYFKNTCQKRT